MNRKRILKWIGIVGTVMLVSAVAVFGWIKATNYNEKNAEKIESPQSTLIHIHGIPPEFADLTYGPWPEDAPRPGYGPYGKESTLLDTIAEGTPKWIGIVGTVMLVSAVAVFVWIKVRNGNKKKAGETESPQPSIYDIHENLPEIADLPARPVPLEDFSLPDMEYPCKEE